MVVFKHQIQEGPAVLVGVFCDWLSREERLKEILVQNVLLKDNWYCNML